MSAVKLDGPTRSALSSTKSPPSTIFVKLTGGEILGGRLSIRCPNKPEDQAKLKFMGYRNMLEKVAERYHTTPQTVVALNGPDKLIRPPPDASAFPCRAGIPHDYGGAINDKQARLDGDAQRRRRPAQGRFHSSSTKAMEHLRVYRSEEAPQHSHGAKPTRQACFCPVSGDHRIEP